MWYTHTTSLASLWTLWPLGLRGSWDGATVSCLISAPYSASCLIAATWSYSRAWILFGSVLLVGLVRCGAFLFGWFGKVHSALFWSRCSLPFLCSRFWGLLILDHSWLRWRTWSCPPPNSLFVIFLQDDHLLVPQLRLLFLYCIRDCRGYFICIFDVSDVFFGNFNQREEGRKGRGMPASLSRMVPVVLFINGLLKRV